MSSPNTISPNRTKIVIPQELRSLDVEVKVYEGPPKSIEEAVVYNVEKIPHIHNADLTIRRPLSEKDEHVGDTRVMVAHGFRGIKPDGEAGWMLADGRSVVGVAEHYNEMHPDKPIDILAVCNPTDSQNREHGDIQHARGSAVDVSGWVESSGEIGMHLNLAAAETGSWFLRDDSGKLRTTL